MVATAAVPSEFVTQGFHSLGKGQWEASTVLSAKRFGERRVSSPQTGGPGREERELLTRRPCWPSWEGRSHQLVSRLFSAFPKMCGHLSRF